MKIEYCVLLLGMGIVTFVPRWLPLAVFSRRQPPRWLSEWLELVPAAILSALLAPALLLGNVPRQVDLARPELWAALPTFLLAVKTRSLVGTVLAGMLFYSLAERFI